jgi:hypothetical protein
MRRRSIETKFNISITESFVEVRFAPIRSLYIFTRLTAERDVAEFGPLSPDPVIQQASRALGTCSDAADALATVFRFAMAAARART